jgi:flagellar biosynthesis protein FlhF
MRLKTFHAKSMNDAMDQVREELGPDAIIISIDEGKSSVRITAALEAGATPPPPETAPAPEQTPLAYEASHTSGKSREFDKGDIAAVMAHHGIPFDTASHFEGAINASNSASSLNEAFSLALDTNIRISPITDAVTRPIILVGPPGAGKTICAAKLTADALLHERDVTLISTDTVKAGGIAQLDHFAQLMKQTVLTADTPEELSALLKSKRSGLTLIDSPGTNPFDMDELKTLLKFIRIIDAEPVLVLPAGLDPDDAQEIADVFSKMGCQRFIATRLDAARRYASVIMAARPGFLSLAAYSRSPYIADGLENATPMKLAKLLTALPRRKTDVSGFNSQSQNTTANSPFPSQLDENQ